MQKCSAILAPLSRHLARGIQVQPSRNFFIRRKSFPPAIWESAADVERHVRDIARQFDRLEREIENQWRLNGFPMPPSLSFPRTSAPMSMYESEVDGKYQMNVVMGEKFVPENIKVTLKDRVLTIEAKYDHSSEDGKSRVYQEFSRQFTLPENINPSEVKSMFTPDGILQIEAPLPPQPEGSKPKEIPISFESSKK